MMKKMGFILFLFLFYMVPKGISFAEVPKTLTKAFTDRDEVKEKATIISEKKAAAKKQQKKKVVEPELKPENLDDDLDCTKAIQYTEEQKKHLDQIYNRIYQDYYELIETYAWAGALTDEQKLVRHQMLRNYILTFAKRNYQWCSEWEEDEWEEEWFNIDRD
ncbi:DUF2680 domain-containing protein [Neobacillus niacini]|uniref:DUF2680 domain-containing protein n=1 Tax=Neobacillus niacini TaxID=86668 RepID=UPI0021CB209D|nr:DUF2680 domain-containing protein [Neobacillus niacini]MCM3764894.1 DUF2680 domain-containing protein [Neobacillus niacini]